MTRLAWSLVAVAAPVSMAGATPPLSPTSVTAIGKPLAC
jgi:hypothetical protein